ncbi:MAG: aldo/keto reductase [Gammaproteobacteria bacterium]|nr:MAG: aldo/keto reductase [Gammaproteobacteria bacterium]
MNPHASTVPTINGIPLSPAGLGTVKIGRNRGVKYPSAFALPDDKAVRDLLALAHDLGIRLLDTAPAYGSSETRLGQLLPARNDWVICTKVGESFKAGQSHFDFSAAAVRDSVHRSLKRLRRERLDIVLIHSNGDDTGILANGEAVETLDKLKQAGLIGAIGLSGKTPAGGEAALADCGMDIAMITQNADYRDEQNVIDCARRLGKGILVKKAFASGHLLQQGESAIERNLAAIFTGNRDLPLSVILGTINPAHLRQNMDIIARLTAEETA